MTNKNETFLWFAGQQNYWQSVRLVKCVFYDNRDNKITVSNSSTAPCFWKTTETTGTTRRTDATAGCHEVTYNWDNKITVVNSFSLSTVVFFQTTTMTTGITGTTVNVTRWHTPHTFLKNVFWAHNATHYIKYCQQESKNTNIAPHSNKKNL